MTDNEYLQEVLKSQDLADDSSELKALRERRKHVEDVLRAAFPDSAPTIRYGGSKAKGTLIKESYDLDLVCYFAHDDTSAGESLKDIYNNVATALEKEYSVVRKRSALRLRDRQAVDFHIDVVPGRFTDESKQDCFLYQENGDKCRLKTNLDVHIEHVRESGVLDAIRLLKLWKTRKAISVKQFAFELLIIKLLNDRKKKPLTEQLTHVWTELRDTEQPITVEDPANPSGNDLMPLLAGSTWTELQTVARSTLSTIDQSGWEAVFGKVEKEGGKAAAIAAAVASVSRPTRPWGA
jgi:hypothetical protein